MACTPLMMRVLSGPAPDLTAGIMVFVVVGAYATAHEPLDVVAVFVFGALGWFMKAYGYSRPALLLGFILSPMIETYLYISPPRYGLGLDFPPGALPLPAYLAPGPPWSPPWGLARRC